MQTGVFSGDGVPLYGDCNETYDRGTLEDTLWYLGEILRSRQSIETQLFPIPAYPIITNSFLT